MTTYAVIRKSDQEKVYEYASASPVEWGGFEFATHDHVAQPDAVASPPPPPIEAWHLYPGPFKDRLGMDALAIGGSTHPVCAAVREMMAGREYIDLRHPQTIALLDLLIATGQPVASPYFPGSGPMTAQKKATILNTPPSALEAYRG